MLSFFSFQEIIFLTRKHNKNNCQIVKSENLTNFLYTGRGKYLRNENVDCNFQIFNNSCYCFDNCRQQYRFWSKVTKNVCIRNVYYTPIITNYLGYKVNFYFPVWWVRRMHFVIFCNSNYFNFRFVLVVPAWSEFFKYHNKLKNCLKDFIYFLYVKLCVCLLYTSRCV